jgi:hypothetical protein
VGNARVIHREPLQDCRMTKTRLRKLTVKQVITYRNSTPGPNVTKFDRAMLLRRLASLSDGFDLLVANGAFDEALRLRKEFKRCLVRLGVPSGRIVKFMREKRLPELVERDDDYREAAADAAQPHDEED